ncbi:MAG: hypothetical protein ABIN79_07620, partial [Marmoricola sp.]
AVADARASAVAAVDGDPGTTWAAAADDEDPTLSVRWLGQRTVRAVSLTLDRQAAASRPTRVELVYPSGRQSVDLDADGTARVRPFRAGQVDVRITRVQRTSNLHADGGLERVGAGVSELRLDGMGLLPITLSEVPFDIGCDFGPTLRVGIGLYPTSVTASPRALFEGGMLPATVCGPPRIDVAPGSTRVVLAPAPAFRGVRVVMRSRTVAPPAVTPAVLSGASPVERELEVPPSFSEARIAVVRENQSKGWVASVPGPGAADRVTVDGWQQGWQLDGQVERLDLRFVPDRLYRSSLALGGILLVLLLVAGLWLRRRPGGEPPLGPRQVHPWALALGGVLALGVMAGWVALACGAAAVGATAVVGRRAPSDLVAWLSGIPVAVAALFYWLRPLGSADGWAGSLAAPQLLVAVTLGLLVSTDLSRAGRPRSLRRRAGRSTSR